MFTINYSVPIAAVFIYLGLLVILLVLLVASRAKYMAKNVMLERFAEEAGDANEAQIVYLKQLVAAQTSEIRQLTRLLAAEEITEPTE